MKLKCNELQIKKLKFSKPTHGTKSKTKIFEYESILLTQMYIHLVEFYTMSFTDIKKYNKVKVC